MLKGRKRRLLASPQHAMFAIIDYIPRAVRENGQPNDPMIVEFTLAGAPMMNLDRRAASQADARRIDLCADRGSE